MNLLLLESTELAEDGIVRLGDRRAEHIRKVLRAEPGRTLRVGVIGGGLGAGRVLSIEGESVTLAVEVGEEPPRPPGIDLRLLERPRSGTTWAGSRIDQGPGEVSGPGGGRVRIEGGGRVARVRHRRPLRFGG